MGAGGTQHIVSGTAPLRVTVANPSGVQLQIAGKSLKPPSAQEFLLAADGRVLKNE